MSSVLCFFHDLGLSGPFQELDSSSEKRKEFGHLENHPRKKNVLQESLRRELRHDFQIMSVSKMFL
jgi:hypothetical protein